MSEPFLAEIRIVGFNFAPHGNAQCDGAILPISQNQSLFSLLGTAYGGDGRTSFGLPDLRGRTPIHTEQTTGTVPRVGGERGGVENHTLIAGQMPSHTHRVRATPATATATVPGSSVLPGVRDVKTYRPRGDSVAMHSTAVTKVGGGQQHNNMQPYLVLNYIIALQGLFPSHN